MIATIIAAIIALITAIAPEIGERAETRITSFIERTCPTATTVIVAAGGVADAWAQARTGDPTATTDVLPRRVIEVGRELCAAYATE